MKRIKIVVLLFAIGLSLSLGSRVSGQDGGDLPQDVVERGLALSPVPVNLEGRNRVLVGLGSYLVNTSGCNDCHTNPPYVMGGDPFMGQPEQIPAANFLAGGQEFGPFTSRNLTPELDTGRPELTFEEFLETLRTGRDHEMAHPEISPLLQVMPWPVYGKKNDFEIRAMYEYLSAIPHAEPPQ